MPLNSLKIVIDATCRIPNAHIKGRANKGKSACAVIFFDEDEQEVARFTQYLGDKTPPEAEYNALLLALDKAPAYCRKNLNIWTDSDCIVKHADGSWGLKSENIKPLFDKAKELERRVNGVINYYHHSRNTKLAKLADKLANQEIDKHQL